MKTANNTVYSKGDPHRMVFWTIDKVYMITVAETVPLSPNMVAAGYTLCD